MTRGRIANPRLRSRSVDGTPHHDVREDWEAARAALVVCDMWDVTLCVSAARRVVEMAPRINDLAGRLRSAGALIVHAPAGCMEFYEGTAARAQAQRAPRVISPVPVDWQDWNPSREAVLPPSLADDTPCSCEPSAARCTTGGPPYPMTRQIETIEILPDDAVTDDGEELLALLEQRGIQDVIITGVHANRCVLGRPYGIRQLVYWGKRPMLCRDLTDSYHRDPHGHLWGNETIVAHIERYWCPTLTSDQFLGGSPFRFSDSGA